MKKLSVFASREDLDSLIRTLTDLRCVELSELPTDAESGTPLLMDNAKPLEKSETEKKIADITEALRLTHKYAKKVKSLLDPKTAADIRAFDKTPEYAEANELLASVLAKGERLKEIGKERAKVQSALDAYLPWEMLDVPLGTAGTSKTLLLLGSFAPGVSADRVREALADTDADFTPVSEGAALAGAVVCLKTDADAVTAALLPLGFLRAAFPADADTAKTEADRLRQTLKALEKEETDLTESFHTDAERVGLLEILSDYEKTKLTETVACGKSGHTEYTAVLAGYTPAHAAKKVEKALGKFDCVFEIEDVPEGEDAPIELSNGKISTTFEWVMGMYSYPAYGTYDPTRVMSIFYFLIFGLMFADAGYGLLLMLAGFLGIKLLHPKPGMRNFLAMFGWCGISSLLWGVLLGSYFGDLPIAIMKNMTHMALVPDTLAVWFDPIANPMTFLIVSLAVGAVHLIGGMAVQFYILCKDGHPLDALFDIGSWWVLFCGIGLFAAVPAIGKWVALAGVLMLVLTQGRHEKNPLMKLVKGVGSLYDIISYASDLLSYARILALGLASAVIAQVVNILATLGGPSVVGFIVMVAVAAFGHLLNLVINVLGTFVHTSRLQYIEFFGKFFTAGGKKFEPLAPTEDYTYKG